MCMLSSPSVFSLIVRPHAFCKDLGIGMSGPGGTPLLFTCWLCLFYFAIFGLGSSCLRWNLQFDFTEISMDRRVKAVGVYGDCAAFR